MLVTLAIGFSWPLATVLAALATTFAALVLLYRLRPPPRAVVVSALALWRAVSERSRHQRHWRRLLSLAISTAVASAILLALAGLDLTAPRRQRLEVIVVDNGPTLSTATQDGRTRFDHGLDSAERRIETASGTVLVLDTTEALESAAPGTRALARTRLARLRAAGIGSGRASRAMPTAEMALWSERWRQRYGPSAHVGATLITDGVGITAPAGMTVVSVFEPAENVGIVSLGIEAFPAERPQIYAEIANAGARPAERTLVIETERGEEIARQPLRLAAGARWSGLLELPRDGHSGEGGAAVRARLVASRSDEEQAGGPHEDLAGDARPEDDTATLASPGERHARIVLVGAAPGLERALAALPFVELFREPASGSSSDSAGSADLVVRIADAPLEPPTSPTLLIDPPERWWLPSLERRLPALLIGWQHDPLDLTSRAHDRGADHANAPAAAPQPEIRSALPLVIGCCADSGVQAADPETQVVVALRGTLRTADDELTMPLLFSLAPRPHLAIVPFSLSAPELVEAEGYPILVASLLEQTLAATGIAEPLPSALERANEVLVNHSELPSARFDAPPSSSILAASRGWLGVIASEPRRLRVALLAFAALLVLTELALRRRGLTE